jgi:hypothetical protein
MPPARQSVQGAKLHFAAFHDHMNVLALPSQAVQVFERIPVDDEQIGKSPGRKTPELARHAEHFGAYRRCAADDFGRRQDLRANREFVAL